MTKDCFHHRGMTADKTMQTMTQGGRCGEWSSGLQSNVTTFCRCIYICVNSLVFVHFVATMMIVPVLALNFVSICVISLSKH